MEAHNHTLQLIKINHQPKIELTGSDLFYVDLTRDEKPEEVVAEVDSRAELVEELKERDIDPSDFENYRVREKKTRKSFVSEVLEGVETWNASTM